MRCHEPSSRAYVAAGLRTLVTLALGLCALALAIPEASASPPAWAPAHGYRAHHHGGDQGDDDDHERAHRAPRGWGPYINDRGVCTWTQLDTALGGALGGAIGSQIDAGSGRAITTIGGVVLGALVGHAIGEQMDGTDQYCAGSALRYAPPGRPVVWVDPHTDWHYRFVPERRFKDSRGAECRHFTQYARRNGHTRRHHGTACREPHGSWHIVR